MSSQAAKAGPAPSRNERVAPPCAIVIFGASGDLTSRKLLPALYNLAMGGLLSERTVILGFGRHGQSDDEFRAAVKAGIDQYSRTRPLRTEVWDALSPRIFYQQGKYDDPESFGQLSEHLGQFEKDFSTEGNNLFYIATPLHRLYPDHPAAW